jgi:hypothetical protein
MTKTRRLTVRNRSSLRLSSGLQVGATSIGMIAARYGNSSDGRPDHQTLDFAAERSKETPSCMQSVIAGELHANSLNAAISYKKFRNKIELILMFIVPVKPNGSISKKRQHPFLH